MGVLASARGALGGEDREVSQIDHGLRQGEDVRATLGTGLHPCRDRIVFGREPIALDWHGATVHDNQRSVDGHPIHLPSLEVRCKIFSSIARPSSGASRFS